MKGRRNTDMKSKDRILNKEREHNNNYKAKPNYKEFNDYDIKPKYK